MINNINYTIKIDLKGIYARYIEMLEEEQAEQNKVIEELKKDNFDYVIDYLERTQENVF